MDRDVSLLPARDGNPDCNDNTQTQMQSQYPNNKVILKYTEVELSYHVDKILQYNTIFNANAVYAIVPLQKYTIRVERNNVRKSTCFKIF